MTESRRCQGCGENDTERLNSNSIGDCDGNSHGLGKFITTIAGKGEGNFRSGWNYIYMYEKITVMYIAATKLFLSE